MAITIKLFGDKMGGSAAASYVGSNGDVFIDAKYGGLRLGDGLHAGGIQLGLETIPTVVDPAYTTYQNALGVWATLIADEKLTIAYAPGRTEKGWEWLNWNMNGETAAAYLAELTAAWAIQQAPTSPPGDTSQLIFKPPLSSALYQQIRSAITLVRDSYATYLIALQHKEIAGVSLTVPDIVQTGADEDLVLRVRASAVTSPPGGTAYTNKDFKLGVNGTLTFPNGTTQTGGAISKAELKTLVAAAADFAAFKTAIAAL
jgi:hypothetical protein